MLQRGNRKRTALVTMLTILYFEKTERRWGETPKNNNIIEKNTNVLFSPAYLEK